MISKEKIDFTLIIPTLGNRTRELSEALEALSASSFKCMLVFVVPKFYVEKIYELTLEFCPDFPLTIEIENTKSSLPKAINQGLAKVETNFWNWMGDDDIVVLDATSEIISVMSKSEKYSIGVGSCQYFSSNSNRVVLNKVHKVYGAVIAWGPNLIPQPSVVFRTKAIRDFGGINARYLLAFDQEVISRSLTNGEILVHSKVTSRYRWSQETLTSRNRMQSLSESHKIRLSFAKNVYQRMLIKILYPIVIVLVRASDFVFRFRFRK